MTSRETQGPCFSGSSESESCRRILVTPPPAPVTAEPISDLHKTLRLSDLLLCSQATPRLLSKGSCARFSRHPILSAEFSHPTSTPPSPQLIPRANQGKQRWPSRICPEWARDRGGLRGRGLCTVAPDRAANAACLPRAHPASQPCPQYQPLRSQQKDKHKGACSGRNTPSCVAGLAGPHEFAGRGATSEDQPRGTQLVGPRGTRKCDGSRRLPRSSMF